jgi:hypothetical protein
LKFRNKWIANVRRNGPIPRLIDKEDIAEAVSNKSFFGVISPNHHNFKILAKAMPKFQLVNHFDLELSFGTNHGVHAVAADRRYPKRP